jgi:hypothetical protein
VFSFCPAALQHDYTSRGRLLIALDSSSDDGRANLIFARASAITERDAAVFAGCAGSNNRGADGRGTFGFIRLLSDGVNACGEKSVDQR